MTSYFTILDDSHSRQLVEDYHRQCAQGPLGVWQSCNDLRMGIGFEAVVGLGATIEFHLDQHGLIDIGGSERVLLTFEWKMSGERAFSARVVECADISRDLIDDSDFEWQTVNYDFLVLSVVKVVFMHEPELKGDDPFKCGFWLSPWPLSRVSGPQDTTPAPKW